MADDIVDRLSEWSPSSCWSCGEWGCTNAAGHTIYCERDCVCDEHYDDTICPSPCRECGGDDVCDCGCHLDLSNEAADEIEALRRVVTALREAGFDGTSVERRDRMYGSGWATVHDALDALEARRG